ncbi:GNAT family N-acetyltransferase [uncultured Ferrovibrio sp.]|jgi:GNAT superfamily N-acetyltransferase|uniref:GNAT family N-acetyltransferase n=1 Tax=uncultured Ferrovibrio sp. TaxID=1576913 RepID=UPI002622B830|nr:GNAT family N-acetyltransferase [uncultured Ferrovibrio sp.]
MTKPSVQIADTDEKIAACFPVIHELRPHLKDAAELVARVKRQQKEGFQLGYVEEAGKPVACIGFRRQERLVHGPLIYVDDLATLSSVRSKGYGAIMLDWVEALAKSEGRKVVDLDSGTHRVDAHRFYHRQRYTIVSFHFVKRV